MKLLIVNGVNLSLTGKREKGVYGEESLESICAELEEFARKHGHEAQCVQSDLEGELCSWIHGAEGEFDGIVLNAGAFTHYSYAIRDALASVTIPKVEIHISDITKREEFRKVSVTAPVCDKQIYGQGLAGYLQAIDHILNVK